MTDVPVKVTAEHVEGTLFSGINGLSAFIDGCFEIVIRPLGGKVN